MTLCQWKPGVNRASWELPPGGIGELEPGARLDEIMHTTRRAYLKETGFGGGELRSLGQIAIETSKYRGLGPEEHGTLAHLFLATELERMDEARKLERNEIMENLLVPLHEFPAVLGSGHFIEESAVACAYKALLELGMLRWSL